MCEEKKKSAKYESSEEEDEDEDENESEFDELNNEDSNIVSDPFGEQDGSGVQSIRLRRNFNSLAHFSVTNTKNGVAVIPIQLPDSLTRYRLVCMATANLKYFGTCDGGPVTAQLPITLRSSIPQFINYGDLTEVNILVQNLTKSVLPIKLVVYSQHKLLRVYGSSFASYDEEFENNESFQAGYITELPSNRNFKFLLKGSSVGTEKLHIICYARNYCDASEYMVRIPPPFSTISTINSGDLIQNGEFFHQVFVPPPNSIPNYGQFTVLMDTNSLSKLYPVIKKIFTSDLITNEQTITSTMTLLYFKDEIEQFFANNTSDNIILTFGKRIGNLSSVISNAIRTLRSHSHSYYSYYNYRHYYYYNSLSPFERILQVILLCKLRKKLPAVFKDHSIDMKYYTTGGFDLQYQTFLVCPGSEKDCELQGFYALYALNLVSKNSWLVNYRITRIFKERSVANIPAEALGLLLLVIGNNKKYTKEKEEIINCLNYYYEEIDEANQIGVIASYCVPHSVHDIYYSKTRAVAVVLFALLKVDPQHRIVKGLARYLFCIAKGGCWNSIHENYWASIALKRYFKKNSPAKSSNSPSALVWFSEVFCGEHSVGNNVSKIISIPLQTFKKQQENNASDDNGYN